MERALMHDFFKRLEELRNIKGFSQPKMAKILGINQSTYNRNASGKTLPNTESLCKLALIFPAEQIYYLLTGDKPDTMHLTKGKEGEERELMNIFRALPHKKQLNLLDMIRPDTIESDDGPQPDETARKKRPNKKTG